MKITEKKENKLFKRKEIRAAMESATTPSRQQVLDLLAKEFSCPADNIKIKGIRGNFGTREFTIEANIYDSPADKDFVEIKKKKEAAPAKEAAAQ